MSSSATLRRESLDGLIRRVEAEFLEMPGLQLTREQAQRLWTLDRATCAAVLDALIDRRFLVRGTDHRYRRGSDGSLPERATRRARADIHLPDVTRRAS